MEIYTPWWNDKTFCETINVLSDTEDQAKIINDNSDSYYNVLIHPKILISQVNMNTLGRCVSEMPRQ